VHTAHIRPFIPLEAHPAHVFENAGLGLARRALHIRILDAQDERTFLAVREQPVEQRRSGVADVQLPGRTRRESDSHSFYLRWGPTPSACQRSLRSRR
jgi:hypothetical protein